MAIVRYRPKKESARKPPNMQSKKDVPMKSVTIFADSALGRCIVPPKYVTRLTAIPMVESLSHISTTVTKRSIKEIAVSFTHLMLSP